MTEKTPHRDEITGIEALQWVFAAMATACALLLFVAAVIDREVDGPPEWLMAAAAVAAAVPSYFVSRYYLRRPLEEPGLRDYAVTVLFRAGVAILPSVVGFAGFLATGAWWIQALGVALSIPGFFWSVPSLDDYARHRALATEVPEHPPEEEWGSADPHEAAPWDDEHGGHGHGPGDI